MSLHAVREVPKLKRNFTVITRIDDTHLAALLAGDRADSFEDPGQIAQNIGCTAHALEGDQQQCFDAGMNDCLARPFSPSALLDKVGLWLAVERATIRRKTAQRIMSDFDQ